MEFQEDGELPRDAGPHKAAVAFPETASHWTHRNSQG